jgi:AraC-like DNA-binding protein
MSSPAVATPLSLLSPPYEGTRPVGGGVRQLKLEGRRPGCALVWEMGKGIRQPDAGVVRGRPGGLPLLVVLPPAEDLSRDSGLIRLLEEVRPQGILPHHEAPTPEDLACVLRQPPDDLGSEVTEYLRWRGIGLDRELSRLVRRIVALSAELRSVSALARSMYLSRRALGRRFMARGLPVPSHWLHFARLLRVAIRLQNCDESVLSVGYELGYPDGFSLSNQMARLTGHRPTEARMYFGWEWLMEAWLRQEAESGGLAPELTVEVLQPGVQPRRATAGRYEAPRKLNVPTRPKSSRSEGALG